MAAASTYLRFPHLRADRLVFTAQDEVWLTHLAADVAAPVRAHRLTADRAVVSRPRLSPDGNGVVWVSRRTGEAEVFYVGLDGAVPRQLTWFGAPTTVTQVFDSDGRLIVTTAAGQPFRSRTWAYAIDVDEPAALPERLPYGPVNSVARGTSALVVGTGYSRDHAHWKRYRGGTAGRLWISKGSDTGFTELLAHIPGPKTAPTWVGDRLAFLADFQGYGNVYSVSADGTDLRRHTDHADYYARQLTGDGTRLVYSHAGQLWLLSDLEADSTPIRLSIALPGSRSGRARVELAAADLVGDAAVDRTGRASVVEVRGTVQWLPHRDGPARTVTSTAGVRCRLPVVLSADGTVAYVTDIDGSDAIDIASADVESPDAMGPVPAVPDPIVRRYGAGMLGRVLELVASPDGSRLAIATHDGRVLLMATADGAVTELARSSSGDASGLTFSPDSAWLAFAAAQPSRLSSIALVELASGIVTPVTVERFGDSNPAFSLDGRYLMFLSARTFDPIYDAHVFDLSFPHATRPYLVTLSAADPSPFDPQVGGRVEGAKPDTERDKSIDQAGEESDFAGPKPVVVDLDGLAERVVAFPVAAGQLSALTAVKGGAAWLASPVAGQLGEARAADADERPSLQRWDFEHRKQTELVSHLDAVHASGDGLKLLVRDKDELRVLPSEHPASDDGGDSLELDLSRLRLQVDPPAEWRQMVSETARLMQDHFWVEGMSGLDWTAATERWLEVVDAIDTRDDLSDVLWELNGETGSSHAYETAPAVPISPWLRPAFLGVDLTRNADGAWLIERVLPGDNSVRAARSPLAAPGVRARSGDVILAVNGVPVPDSGPAELLRGTAGKPVLLALARDGIRRTVAVTPLASDTGLRYLDWVSGRRAIVHEATGGRVGYVHIPDMVSTGWAELHRDLRTEIARDGLIVDTRDNGGGHTSQLVIEKLMRRVIGWDTARHLPLTPYPEDAPRGPLVSIANEWAGSDGDIVNAAFKALRLGPVLGVRTWGGVIGIDGRYSLVDGTAVTQPRYSFWFAEFGWSVENHGVDPDIVVEFPPHAWGAGEDPQLAAAIEQVLTELAQRPGPVTPDLATRPSLRAPELPPRPGP